MTVFANVSDISQADILKTSRSLTARAVRVVESQEKIATLELVDSIEEQAALEELLEATKPRLRPKSKYHYLIQTPFRYPPLKYGSRFGTRERRGIFYASLSYRTAFAECAYYRFIFLQGMQEPYGKRIFTHHHSFWVNVNAQQGVALQDPPFQKLSENISHPSQYSVSQEIGSQMRDAGVECCSYISARTEGINLAVFDINCIRSKQPLDVQSWIAHYDIENPDAQKISFLNQLPQDKNQSQSFTFQEKDFHIKKKLPQPAI